VLWVAEMETAMEGRFAAHEAVEPRSLVHISKRMAVSFDTFHHA
jgi:hypothetical protein